MALNATRKRKIKDFHTGQKASLLRRSFIRSGAARGDDAKDANYCHIKADLEELGPPTRRRHRVRMVEKPDGSPGEPAPPYADARSQFLIKLQIRSRPLALGILSLAAGQAFFFCGRQRPR